MLMIKKNCLAALARSNTGWLISKETSYIVSYSCSPLTLSLACTALLASLARFTAIVRSFVSSFAHLFALELVGQFNLHVPFSQSIREWFIEIHLTSFGREMRPNLNWRPGIDCGVNDMSQNDKRGINVETEVERLKTESEIWNTEIPSRKNRQCKCEPLETCHSSCHVKSSNIFPAKKGPGTASG